MAGDVNNAALDKLPIKLRARLMPFQRDGVIFAVKKNGRYVLIPLSSFCFDDHCVPSYTT